MRPCAASRLALSAVVVTALLGSGAQARMPPRIGPPTAVNAAATPPALPTPTPTSCVSDPPLVNPVTSPTDQLVQTITGYSPGLLCGRGGFISVDGVTVRSQSQNCMQGTFEATIELQPDQTNHFDVCLHPGLCGSGGCTAVEIVHHSASAPEISVTPSTLSLGCEGAFTITVASAGPAGSTLEISALTLANGYSQGYYGTGFTWDLSGITLPASLPSGATLDIPVTFGAAGQSYPSRLELTVDSNAAADPHLFLVYFGAAQEACEATPTPTLTPTPTPCPECTLLGSLFVSDPSVEPAHPVVGDEVTFTFHVTAALPGGFDCEQCTFEGGEGYLAGEDPPVEVDDTVVAHRRVVRAGSTTIRLHTRETTEEQCYSPDPMEGCRMFFQPAFIEADSPPFGLVLGGEAACAGDCDANGTVVVNEVVTLVDIALGDAALSSCAVGDRNGDGRITIDELIKAVHSVLDQCPAPPAFAIRGTVTEFLGCTGYMRGVGVMLDPLGLTATTAIGPDPAVAGTFAFEDVPPGDYTLTVSPSCNPYGCWPPTAVSVVDRDVDVLICNAAS